MKTWLKGGLIGLVFAGIVILCSILYITGFHYFPIKTITNLFFIPLVYLIPCGGYECLLYSYHYYILLTLILYFILGSIIGLIIQKVRK